MLYHIRRYVGGPKMKKFKIYFCAWLLKTLKEEDINYALQLIAFNWAKHHNINPSI